MLSPSRCCGVETRTLRVVLHEHIASQVHGAEVHGEVDVGQSRELLDDAERKVLKVVRIQVGETQCVAGNDLEHLIDGRFRGARKCALVHPQRAIVRCMPMLARRLDRRQDTP